MDELGGLVDLVVEALAEHDDNGDGGLDVLRGHFERLRSSHALSSHVEPTYNARGTR